MGISQNSPERWLRLPRASRAPVPQRYRFRPRLEGLEERTVLSTLTVLNALDKGAGSLRDTITKAKSGDAIVFDPSLDGQTIRLTSDQLEIKKNLDIEGPGASLLAISGNDTNRIFAIDAGLTVTIAGLTLTHGRAVGATARTGGGGAIMNVGSTVTIANDVFSDNVDVGGSNEAQGGAISNVNAAAMLTVTDSTFNSNRAEGSGQDSIFCEGGAIYNGPDGSAATVIRCTFVGNQALGGEANGGALHNEHSSSLTVEDSTFIGNQAIAGSGGSVQKGVGFYILDGGFGGAIADDEATGPLVVSGCTFSYNQAIGGSHCTGNATGQGVVGVGGGGALGIIGVATVTNSRFDHNEALGGSDNSVGSPATVLGRGVGGAIHNGAFEGVPSTLTLGGCTFTDNQAVGGAGNTGSGFVNEGLGGALDNNRGATATVTGCTFSDNQAIGGQGGTGQEGGPGLGGALANLFGSTLTVSGCTLSGNQAIGGAGGSGASGGNGFGGGICNTNQSTLTLLTSTINGNEATGGTAGAGGSAGLGEGGGLYLADGGIACLDAATSVTKNHASTGFDDIFGVFTICS